MTNFEQVFHLACWMGRYWYLSGVQMVSHYNFKYVLYLYLFKLEKWWEVIHFDVYLTDSCFCKLSNPPTPQQRCNDWQILPAFLPPFHRRSDAFHGLKTSILNFFPKPAPFLKFTWHDHVLNYIVQILVSLLTYIYHHHFHTFSSKFHLLEPLSSNHPWAKMRHSCMKDVFERTVDHILLAVYICLVANNLLWK